MDKYPQVLPFSLLTDFNPCNMSTIVLECEHPSLYMVLVEKSIVLLYFTYLMASFIRKRHEYQKKVILSATAFCACAIMYISFYFCLEYFSYYSIYKGSGTQIRRLRLIPLDGYFLCQASYLSEIAEILVLVKIPGASTLRYVFIGFKYFAVGLIFFTLLLFSIPHEKLQNLTIAVMSWMTELNSILYSIIFCLVIVALSIAFIFSKFTSHIFPRKQNILMHIAIFFVALSCALDYITHTWGHSNYFIAHLYWTNRKTYLYLDMILKFFYHDLPLISLSFIVYILSIPDTDENAKSDGIPISTVLI